MKSFFLVMAAVFVLLAVFDYFGAKSGYIHEAYKYYDRHQLRLRIAEDARLKKEVGLDILGEAIPDEEYNLRAAERYYMLSCAYLKMARVEGQWLERPGWWLFYDGLPDCEGR